MLEPWLVEAALAFAWGAAQRTSDVDPRSLTRDELLWRSDMLSRYPFSAVALAAALALALTAPAMAKPKGWGGGPGWGKHAGRVPPGHMKPHKWRYAPPHRYGWMPPGHAKRYRSARIYAPPRVYWGW
jgi:hypothetical protein